MYTFIVILCIIVCILLGLIVLVQNSKGGGLAANFSAPTQVMGVRQTADFLEKASWWLAGILVVLCLMAPIVNHNQNGKPKRTEQVQQQQNNAQQQQNNAQQQGGNTTAEY